MPWHRNKRSLLTAVFAVIGLGYPFLVYFGLLRFSAGAVIWLVLAMLVLRMFFVLRRGGLAQVLLFGAVFVALAAISLLDTETAVRFYPVAMSVGLAVLFGWSLLFPPTMIERLARLREPDLPVAGIRYTRKVTWLWLMFFLVNGSIAAWTVWFGSLEQWTLYNGFISYVAMGVLFAGEFLIRLWMRRKAGGI